jgi:hypothetical protein
MNKMMRFSVPPGYVRKKPPVKPKLDPFIAVIDSILHVGFGRRPAVQPGVEVDKRQILTLLGREIYCRTDECTLSGRTQPNRTRAHGACERRQAGRTHAQAGADFAGGRRRGQRR